MDGWTFVVALLLVGGLLVPQAAGQGPAAMYPVAPRVFVATNSSYATVGDNVSIDVYVYSGGDLADAVGLPQVSLANPLFPLVNVSVQGLSHAGVGHYHAWLVLPPVPGTPLERYASIEVAATAVLGGMQVSNSVSVTWIISGLFLRFFSDVTTVAPVQTMHLTAELYNGTRPVDADAGTMRFYAVGYVQSSGPMTPNRTATGVYEADATLNESVFYGFVANATIGGIAVSRQLSFFVRPPDSWYPGFTRESYQVWFQTISSNADAVQGNLWVADPWGQPAPGVLVHMTFRAPVQYVNGTTDAQGRLPLQLAMTGGALRGGGTVGGNSPLGLSVYAILPFSSCVRGFGTGGSVIVSAADPFVLPDGSLRDYLMPGASVTRNYHAVNGSFYPTSPPLANAPLNYYLAGFDTGAVYGAGHAITDAGGDFSLSFTVPPEKFAIVFDIQGSAIPSSGISYSVASADMGLAVSSLTLGGPTRVTTTFSSRAAPWANAGFGEAAGSIGLVTSGVQTWTEWGPGYGCPSDFLRSTTGGLNATFFLPTFLPTTGRYLVVASAILGSRFSEQFAVLSVGQAASIPVGGNVGLDLGTILLWSAAGILLAAIAAIGIWTVLRRKPKAPPQPPRTPPT